jgi:thiol-disulfide isomerase/thioredoxin
LPNIQLGETLSTGADTGGAYSSIFLRNEVQPGSSDRQTVMIPRLALRRLRSLVVPALLVVVAHAQQGLDAASLLRTVSQKYREAKQYHIEAEVTETQTRAFSGGWQKSFQTAIVADDGRYRFEARGSVYSWIQVSNGRKEWTYNAKTDEYTEKRTASDKNPREFGKKVWSGEETQLIEAHEMVGRVADEIGAIREPELAGTEALSLDDQKVECLVVHSVGQYHSGELPGTKLAVTFWIEKDTDSVRKIDEHWDGEIDAGDATHSDRENVTVYPVVVLADPALAAGEYAFQPPLSAKPVSAFSPARITPVPRSRLVGAMAPAVQFRTRDGSPVALSSFRGMPVLIEFWATWCCPCVEALPKLEEIYKEAQAKGVAVISVDEDEEAATAAAYLSAHRKGDWPNYHDDGEINRALPGYGLPQFVLIDPTGKIVFVTSGFEDHKLWTALAHLAIGLRALAKKE